MTLPRKKSEKFLRKAGAWLQGQYEVASFSELLSMALELLNWKPKQLATKMEVIPATVYRWKTGQSKPLPGMQRLVIRNLHLEVRSLNGTARKRKKTVSYTANAQECVGGHGGRAYATITSRVTGSPAQAQLHAKAIRSVLVTARAEERARIALFHATGRLGLRFRALDTAWIRRVEATRVAVGQLMRIEAELTQRPKGHRSVLTKEMLEHADDGS